MEWVKLFVFFGANTYIVLLVTSTPSVWYRWCWNKWKDHGVKAGRSCDSGCFLFVFGLPPRKAQLVAEFGGVGHDRPDKDVWQVWSAGCLCVGHSGDPRRRGWVLAVAVKVHEVLLTKISGENFGDLDGKVGRYGFQVRVAWQWSRYV